MRPICIAAGRDARHRPCLLDRGEVADHEGRGCPARGEVGLTSTRPRAVERRAERARGGATPELRPTARCGAAAVAARRSRRPRSSDTRGDAALGADTVRRAPRAARGSTTRGRSAEVGRVRPVRTRSTASIEDDARWLGSMRAEAWRASAWRAISASAPRQASTPVGPPRHDREREPGSRRRRSGSGLALGLLRSASRTRRRISSASSRTSSALARAAARRGEIGMRVSGRQRSSSRRRARARPSRTFCAARSTAVTSPSRTVACAGAAGCGGSAPAISGRRSARCRHLVQSRGWNT